MKDERVAEITGAAAKASPLPWKWAYAQGEEPTDDADLLAMGIDTVPTEWRNLQLKANGNHRFWVELTDTKLAGDVIFDLDFIQGCRQWVPELLAEVARLRKLLDERP